MLTVACVNAGNYLGLGGEYVKKLHRAVSTHLTIPHRFVCFTDDESLSSGGKIRVKKLPKGVYGWWNKLAMFRAGALEGRVIYFDLDTVILQNIDFLADFCGDFAILRDFYRPDGYGSGIMVWNGDHSHIWNDWDRKFRPDHVLGDQGWMEQYKAELLQDLYPGQIVSYKAHCEHGVPEGAAIVAFHGMPRPHMTELWNV